VVVAAFNSTRTKSVSTLVPDAVTYSAFTVFQCGEFFVKPPDNVHDTGAHVDSELDKMKQHIGNVVSARYFHLRRSSSLIQLVNPETKKPLVCSSVVSRIEYCYSVLASSPYRTLMTLRRVSTVARNVCNLRLRDHVTAKLEALR
jgi:hypothetical protein